MNDWLERFYQKAPIFVQTLMTSAYGLVLYRQRYRGKFDTYLTELQESEWYDLEQLRALQSKRLQRMVQHAYEYAPYYHQLFKLHGLSPSDIVDANDLARIPLLEKDTLRDPPEAFWSRAFSKKDLILNPTGGTTGTAIPIYATRDAMQYNFAVYEARMLAWAGVSHRDSTATFLGRLVVPIEQSRPPFWRYNKVRNQYILSSFHMSDENLPLYVDKLAEFQPKVVVGYCSAIHTIASYIIRSGRAGEIRPKAVLSSSEVLLPPYRTMIQEAFGCRVFDAYSQGEFCGFISECEQGQLHISTEYGIIEFLPLEGGGDAGQAREMVCTGLFNLATPILRYRVGDLAVPSDENCPCGRALPVVKSMVGRTDAMIITPEGGRISPASMSLAFKLTRGIVECQLIQRSLDQLLIRIVRAPSYDENEHAFMLAEVRKRLGPSIQIETEFVQRLLRTKSGKVRFIVSELSDTQYQGAYLGVG